MIPEPLLRTESLLRKRRSPDLALILATAAVSALLIKRFFFSAKRFEQDQYYLAVRGKPKMIKLAAKPRHIGGKYWLYRGNLFVQELELGADLEKVSICFDYVSDQDITVDPESTGRYPVQAFGTKGYFEWVEVEGSDVDAVMRRNAKRLEEDHTPFEFTIKGPYGRVKYLGDANFYK
jgi:hypothetical protein